MRLYSPPDPASDKLNESQAPEKKRRWMLCSLREARKAVLSSRVMESSPASVGTMGSESGWEAR